MIQALRLVSQTSHLHHYFCFLVQQFRRLFIPDAFGGERLSVWIDTTIPRILKNRDQHPPYLNQHSQSYFTIVSLIWRQETESWQWLGGFQSSGRSPKQFSHSDLKVQNKTWGQKGGLVFKSPCCTSRGPRFSLQRPQSGSPL